MGGKSSTSTSSVQIPPEVLARYNAVNARAETAAANPFQNYGGQFVAGLTGEQQAGINQASQSAQAAQPYYGAATGMTLSGAQDVGALTPGQINQYQNPYTQAVVAPTLQALQQQQGQQLSDQQTQAIKGGAAFGERSNLARNDLMRKQNLGTAEAIAPLYQQGYQQATQTAMGQQGVVASDMARRLQAGQQLAGLGTGAQQAGIQGAQALLAAGTVGQQTQQADLTAKYQEFLQQQGYPFQTAQFLANIAMGTGALSGSTTSTTQPAPFFSDERLKHDAKKIGETNDGLPIYSFKYNGDDRTQIGLMAQDVEKKKPEAVGLAPASDGHMYKTVDYEKATRAKKYAGGGLAPMDNSMGGAVGPMSLGEAFARGGYAYGGPSILGSADHKALMAANVDPEAGPYAEHGIYKTPRNVIPGLGGSKINMGKGAPPPSLVTPSPIGGNAANQIGLGAQALSGLQMVNTGKEAFNSGKTALLGSAPTQADPEGARGLIGGQGKMSGTNIFQSLMGGDDEKAGGGLVVPRSGYDIGGGIDDTKTEDQGDDSGVVIPGMKGGIPLGAGMKAAKLAVASSPSGGGQRGPGNDMLDALKLGKGVMDLGSGLGSLATMFAANGGAIERKGYQTAGRIEDTGIAGTGLGTLGDGDMPADGGGDAPIALAPARDAAPRKVEPDYRGMVEGAFKQRGLDVGDAIRLSHGESGLRPIIGDDGSSAGIWQLHVGGISKQYPNAGKGDDYFKERRPDLDKTLSPIEKRDFLNAPENQEELSHYVADHIGKKGAGAWTVARNQNLFGAGKGEAQPTGLTFGRSGPGMYSGKEASQASLGDVVGEFLPKSVPGGNNFWVPALSGLGSMLSSKSHTLAGAVGEGLVGGVSGYQAQKKQEMETVKNIFDMVKDRFTQIVGDDGKIAFRDKFGGVLQPNQLQSTVAKILTDAGIDPAPYGMSRPQVADAGTRQMSDAGTSQGAPKPAEVAAGKPVVEAVTETAKPKAIPAEDKPEHELTANDYERRILANPDAYGLKRGSVEDPNVRMKNVQSMRARADQLARSQIPGSAAEANSLRTQASSEMTDLKKDMEKIYGADVARNLEIQKSQVTRADKHADEGAVRTAKLEKSIGDIDTLAALQAEGMKSGVSTSLINRMKSAYQSITGQEMPLVGSTPAAQYEYAVKIAAARVAESIKEIGGQRAPGVTSSLEGKIAPDPEKLTPGAIHLLLGQAKGDALYNMQRDADFEKNHRYSDPAQHARKFSETAEDFNGKKLTGQEKYNRQVAKAYSSLPQPTADPTMAENTAFLRKKYGHLGYEPKVSGSSETQPAPTAPAIPAPLQSIEGLQYSASRNQYRDKAGNMYDASGKRVQ